MKTNSNNNQDKTPAKKELESIKSDMKPKRFLEVLSPSDCINFEPPADYILAGDCHLTRGNITVLGGAPGVGKSRAALGLAVAGAKGVDWMGYKVTQQFKTLIIQCENGMFRLKGEFTDIGEKLDDWVRITPPPTYGLAFDEIDFRLEVKKLIEDWKPGLVVIDPWNRTAQGDKQSDYRAALDGIQECLPEDTTQKPAVLIVHHLRKKSNDAQHKQGRDLLHELAGSYQIGSAARCVLALEAASTDTEDDRVVLTCCKNNDGREGDVSAWHRRNGLFMLCDEFDWDQFYEGAEPNRGINPAMVREALAGMAGEPRGQAVKRLVSNEVCKKSKAYTIIANHENIEEDKQGKLWWKE